MTKMQMKGSVHTLAMKGQLKSAIAPLTDAKSTQSDAVVVMTACHCYGALTFATACKRLFRSLASYNPTGLHWRKLPVFCSCQENVPVDRGFPLHNGIKTALWSHLEEETVTRAYAHCKLQRHIGHTWWFQVGSRRLCHKEKKRK